MIVNVEGRVTSHESDSDVPFWTGRRVVCRNCGGEFTLQSSDKPSARGGILVRGMGGVAYFDCPTQGCGFSVTVNVDDN